MCFLWLSEQTAFVPLCSVNSEVYLTEANYVYCAVLTEYLNTVQDNLRL